MNRLSLIVILLLTIWVTGFNYAEASDVLIREDLAKHFQGYTGTFVCFDEKNDQYIIYNKEQSEKRISPCSTFKIYNSLIGLETGAVSDENTVIKWNGTEYAIKQWNSDHTLASAIANSVVWYYQELASRVGSDKMQYYIDKISYGNKDISGGITDFWLASSLKITPQEQVELLKRLYSEQLPFSKRNMDIAKQIIVLSANDDVVFAGKTGSGVERGRHTIGWFVGTVTKDGNRYYFATNIEAEDRAYGGKAKEITQNILKEMSLL